MAAKALLGLAVVGGVAAVAAVALAKKEEKPPGLSPGIVLVPDGKGGYIPARVGPGGIYPLSEEAARRAGYGARPYKAESHQIMNALAARLGPRRTAAHVPTHRTGWWRPGMTRTAALIRTAGRGDGACCPGCAQGGPCEQAAIQHMLGLVNAQCYSGRCG